MGKPDTHTKPTDHARIRPQPPHLRLLRLRRKHHILPPQRQMPMEAEVIPLIRRDSGAVRRPLGPQTGARRMEDNPRH